jgi:flavin-dependent dehydrogenase
MRIVIVGGGTSGWMTAAAFCKTFPDWDVTLIKWGDPIGVGESTTPHINQYLKFMGIPDEVFLPAARATFKSSSRFDGFAEEGKVFHYPNGQSITQTVKFQEWMLAKEYHPEGLPEFSETFMPFVTVAEQGRLPLNNEVLDPYDLAKDRSFHINGAAFSEFLRETYCSNLTVVDSKVKSVVNEGKNIKHLVVSGGHYSLGGEKVYADLYIDCTGQQAVLSGSLSRWKPYDSILTDTALVVKTDYVNRREEMVPYTNAKAMSAGWQWTIPTYDFISRGYVFGSRFQSEEDARKEFGYEDVKVVKFENGRHERAWTGNCVSIGLSFGFIEPLESTSLFNTHHGILALMDILQEGNLPGQFARDRFNYNLSEHMDGWCEFVEAHYYYSRRRDTPFWRAASDEVEYNVKGTHEVVQYILCGNEPIAHGEMPVLHILAGSGYTNINTRLNEYYKIPELVTKRKVSEWIYRHNRVLQYAETCPHMTDFLSSTFDYA